MYYVNNVVIMQTLQLGQIEVPEEKVHSLNGQVQDLEQKLAKQNQVIANLVGDNLDHLQDIMRLMAHINSSQTRMANLEQKLMELGELFLAAMRQSLLEAGTLDAGGNDRDNQDGGEGSGGAGASWERSSVRATLPPSTLFADSALLRRGYTISIPKA